jgi:tetratricopeptide (TPR) repeat protein
MMKYRTSQTLLLALLLINCHLINAESWKTAKYDTAWLPITKAQLQGEIRKYANDATALFQLWRRARYQKLTQVAFDTFRVLKNQQPRNANILAMYCMSIEQRFTPEGKPRFNASAQEMAVETRRTAIEEAKKLNPMLWLCYAAQGRFEYNTTVFDVDDQVRIYRKALSVAPNISFTNVDYADALITQAFQRKQSYQTAISYIKKAQRLAPVSSETCLDLIMTYRYRVPNRAKERQAAQDYLATIPPRVKLSPERRKWLAQWGVIVPWKG